MRVVHAPDTTLEMINESSQLAPIFGRTFLFASGAFVTEVSSSLVSASSLPGAAASAPIEVDLSTAHLVTEQFRSAGVTGREMIESEEAVDRVVRSIAVDEWRADGTNKLPQVNAIAFACSVTIRSMHRD
jgi:hypothetical protein